MAKDANDDKDKDKDAEEPLIPDEVDLDVAKKKKKKIIIIASAIILLVLVGSGVSFFMFKDKLLKPKAEIKNTETPEQVESNSYLDIDPITVGLIRSGSKKIHLRIDITLRLNSEKDSISANAKVPVVRDSLIVFFRSLRPTDFNNSQSSLYLKEEILKRVNKILAPVVIKEVLFQELNIK